MDERDSTPGRRAIPNFRRWVAAARICLDFAGVMLGQLLVLVLWNGFDSEFAVPRSTFLMALVSSSILILSAGWLGLYRAGRTFMDVVEHRTLLRTVLTATAGTRFLLFLMREPVDAGWFAAAWVGTALVLFLMHRAFRGFCDALRLRGFAEVSALIYGAGEIGRKLARQLQLAPELGIHVVGFLDDRPSLKGQVLDDIPVVGDFSALDRWLAAGRARRIYIALPQVPPKLVMSIFEACRARDVPFHFVPPMPEPLLPLVELHEIEGIPLMGPPPVPRGIATWLRRRLLAVVVGAAGWPAFWVAFLVAWAVRDPKVPLFTRRRAVGVDRKVVVLRRFSTELGRNQLARWTSWLFRQARLDSLPLVWNLLRGDIAVVGPRPMTPFQASRLAERFQVRFSMPAGLTGLWRLIPGGSSSSEELEADIQYLRHQSILLDLSILLRTLDFPGRS